MCRHSLSENDAGVGGPCYRSLSKIELKGNAGVDGLCHHSLSENELKGDASDDGLCHHSPSKIELKCDACRCQGNSRDTTIAMVVSPISPSTDQRRLDANITRCLMLKQQSGYADLLPKCQQEVSGCARRSECEIDGSFR